MSLICRWGILGTASIARKNWKAIRNAGNAALIAVASRDLDRAQQFIDECQASAPHLQVPTPYGGYQKLIDRPDIDAIYIPLPTGTRLEWVIRAAEAGKHVLCEKPCGRTSAEVRAMLDVCRANHVQFMDGTMFMHGQRLLRLKQALDEQRLIGNVVRVTSQFSFRGSDEFFADNIRISESLEPHGCLGDLGWYNIRFALCVMNGQLPDVVIGRALARHARADGSGAVPVSFSGELLYPGGVSASFYCSFLAENQQWAVVSGTQGYLHLSDFVLPFFDSETSFDVDAPLYRVSGCDFNMERHSQRFAVQEYSNGMPNSQEANMIRKFSDIVISGRLEPKWSELAVNTQLVLDACIRSASKDGSPEQLA